MRPTCPECGEPMIFLAVPTASGEVLRCWVCDCQNDLLAQDVQEARADASPDAALSLKFVLYSLWTSEN